MVHRQSVHKVSKQNRIRRGGAITVAVLLAVGIPAFFLHLRAERLAEESGQRQLLADVQREIENYRNEHETYPLELSEIQVTTFRDGARPSMLKQVHYDSDGTTYILSIFGAATRTPVILRPVEQTTQ